jgi:hypothetical protein
MFMQSFENSDKQQKRRSERQLAMQRMNDAARFEGISMTSITSIQEDEEEAKQDPSSMDVKAGEGRVSQLLMNIVATPTSSSSGEASSHMVQRGYHTQKSTGVAPNGSRFSVMEKTAQEFMWDDGSVASGASRLSGELLICKEHVLCFPINAYALILSYCLNVFRQKRESSRHKKVFSVQTTQQMEQAQKLTMECNQQPRPPK